MTTDEPTSVAICVCTYRRPAVLDHLLSELRPVVERSGPTTRVELVVVDDSDAGEARAVVERHSATFDGRVTYCCTGSGNISIARNRALDEGTSRADFVAITDDDCEPHPDWLRALLDVQDRFDADIVTGHCRDLPPEGAPRWYVDEPWIDEPDPGVDGTPLSMGPLKNCLLRSEAIRAAGLGFDEQFGREGGEDALFFRMAARAGLRHVHAADAVVDERVPLDRVALRYQLRRALWYGNSEARTLLASHDQARPRVAASSLKRIASGPLRMLTRRREGLDPQLRWSAAISLTGLGRLLGAFDVRILHSTINRRRDGTSRTPWRRHLGLWRRPEPGMFSVVIPTLQVSPLLHQLVDDLCRSPLVAEVIVINNASPTPLSFEQPKVRVADPGGNIFVNPAWNLGVSMATSDHLIIATDDLRLPGGLLEQVATRLGPKVGIIGPAASCFERPRSEFGVRRVYERPHGFGRLMFLARADYVPIPDELEIRCGDDWLFNQQRWRNFRFDGVEIHSSTSVTAGLPDVSAREERDKERFVEVYAADDPYGARYRMERGVMRSVNRLLSRT